MAESIQETKVDSDEVKTGDEVKPPSLETKEVVASESASPPAESKKKAIIEKVILCVTLFFPLFLATLDTSTIPHLPLLICSNCGHRSSS
jgi:hypothetical protein